MTALLAFTAAVLLMFFAYHRTRNEARCWRVYLTMHGGQWWFTLPLAEKSGVGIGYLAVTLDLLEDAGLIEAEFEAPPADRRPRRMYRWKEPTYE